MKFVLYSKVMIFMSMKKECSSCESEVDVTKEGKVLSIKIRGSSFYIWRNARDNIS